MNAERFFSSTIGVILAATGATFLWGSAFPFIKLSYSMLHIEANEIFEQLLFAGYRFLLAALIILLFLFLSKRKFHFSLGTTKSLVLIGFVQTFLQYLFFYIGLSYSSGIQGSIIAGTTSFFQIIIAHFMYQNDQLNWKKGMGLFLGFSGVILVNLTKGTLQLQFGIGEAFLLIAMFSGAMGNVLAKNASMKMDLFYMTAYQMLLGAIGLSLIGASQSGFFPFIFNWSSALILIYLALLSAVGFILWNSVMKYNKVGRVSIYLFLIPVFGVFLSSIILNETVHSLILFALALVVSGIILVNRTKEEENAAKHSLLKEGKAPLR